MKIEYYADGKKRRLDLEPMSKPQRAAAVKASAKGKSFPVRPQAESSMVMALMGTMPMAAPMRGARATETPMIAPAKAGEPTVIPTHTLSLDGARKSEIAWLRKQFGCEVIKEGSYGKVLLEVPADGNAVQSAALAAKEVHERGNVKSAQPNFLRLMQRPGAGPARAGTQWGLNNPGDPGVAGADVAAQAAWTITEGSKEIRLAILDEGVDTAHPFLKASVVAESDFVQSANGPGRSAKPHGDDAHGTACAGIVASRDEKVRGLAPGISLIASRIGSSLGPTWIADDFDVADAIDWCWEEAEADVLSNSWGGGPPVDLVTNAFTRARTRGRKGKGAVVVIAAGNNQGAVLYPGNLPDILTVGASNQWDMRKTTKSKDGETNWGSNFGTGLDLMAPGVQILTTDISGASGYTRGNTTSDFNGTSAATPFAAAAAALVLSVAPHLDEGDVRDILLATTDSMGPTDWDPHVGWGRLNTFNALREARRRL
jgi:subtilisin family serine protease